MTHDVRFLVVGGIAAALHGSTTLTADVDVLYERERANVRRLAAAVADLDARRRDVAASVRAPVAERALLLGTNFLLTTRAGALNLIGETPSGRFTYAQLAPTAERFVLERGLDIEVVSLDELIRMKRATGRPKDRAELEILSALQAERRRRG